MEMNEENISRRADKIYKYFSAVVRALTVQSVILNISDDELDEYLIPLIEKIDTRVFDSKPVECPPGGGGRGAIDDVEAHARKLASTIGQHNEYGGVYLSNEYFNIKTILCEDGTIDIHMTDNFSRLIELKEQEITRLVKQIEPISPYEYMQNTPKVHNCTVQIADLLDCSYLDARNVILLFL